MCRLLLGLPLLWLSSSSFTITYPQFYIYLNDVRKSCYLLSWAGDRRNKDKEDFIPTLQFQINGNISRLQLASLKVRLQKLNIFNFRDLYWLWIGTRWWQLFRQIVRQKNVVFYCQLSHSMNFYGLKEPSIV